MYILKCITGTDEDKGDIILIPDRSMTPQKSVQSDDSGSKFDIFLIQVRPLFS